MTWARCCGRKAAPQARHARSTWPPHSCRFLLWCAAFLARFRAAARRALHGWQRRKVGARGLLHPGHGRTLGGCATDSQRFLCPHDLQSCVGLWVDLTTPHRGQGCASCLGLRNLASPDLFDSQRPGPAIACNVSDVELPIWALIGVIRFVRFKGDTASVADA